MRPGRRIVFSFIALAVMQGIVGTYLSETYDRAMLWQTFAAMAIVSFPGAVILLAWTLARRQSLPNLRQWLALLLLALPQLLTIMLTPPYSRFLPWLHGTSWGAINFLMLAAPLWLALLAALRIVRDEVPRAISAAAIAGIGAVCLIEPAGSYAVRPDQIPSLIVHLLLLLFTVYSWAFARTRLASISASSAAGSALLLGSLSSAAFSFLLERPHWRPIDWHSLAAPLSLRLLLLIAVTWLWFYLLTRMALSAFSMNMLAMWTTTMAVSFLVLGGFMIWRIDLALAIAITALAVALRARVSDEQPIALGLAEP